MVAKSAILVLILSVSFALTAQEPTNYNITANQNYWPTLKKIKQLLEALLAHLQDSKNEQTANHTERRLKLTVPITSEKYAWSRRNLKWPIDVSSEYPINLERPEEAVLEYGNLPEAKYEQAHGNTDKPEEIILNWIFPYSATNQGYGSTNKNSEQKQKQSPTQRSIDINSNFWKTSLNQREEASSKPKAPLDMNLKYWKSKLTTKDLVEHKTRISYTYPEDIFVKQPDKIETINQKYTEVPKYSEHVLYSDDIFVKNPTVFNFYSIFLSTSSTSKIMLEELMPDLPAMSTSTDLPTTPIPEYTNIDLFINNETTPKWYPNLVPVLPIVEDDLEEVMEEYSEYVDQTESIQETSSTAKPFTDYDRIP